MLQFPAQASTSNHHTSTLLVKGYTDPAVGTIMNKHLQIWVNSDMWILPFPA